MKKHAKRFSKTESAKARKELLASAFKGELRWSEAIRRMRLSLGKTQEDFGRLFGISRRKIIDLEAGKANPELRTLARIGGAFGLTVGFVPAPEMWNRKSGHFEVYQDKASEFRFRLKTAEGQIVLASEGYRHKAGIEHAIESVQQNAQDDARYQRLETRSGQYRFRLLANGNEVIGTSENYVSADACDRAIAAVKKATESATTRDLTSDQQDPTA